MWSNMCIDHHIQYPLFLSDFNEMSFLGRFSKKKTNKKVMKMLLVGAGLFHMDGRTDGCSGREIGRRMERNDEAKQ